MSRFGIDLLLDKTLFRKVSKTPWHQGDGATLFILLSVQVLTGGVLTLSYSNSIEHAYESVQYITQYQLMGWFIRGLHYWSAGLMVVMLMFHFFRVILLGGYKAPREGTWITGVLLFALVIIMSYSGYVLRWDERSIYAVKVLLNILHEVPFIGEELVLFVQGGSEVNSLTLSRFASVHLILAPGILLLLVAYHLYLVILHGPTSPMESKILVKTAEEQKKLYEKVKKSVTGGEDFYPSTVAASGTMGFIVFLLAVVLTITIGPPELYPGANLVETSFPREEWWFWWYSSLVALTPPFAIPLLFFWVPVLLFFTLILLPLLDRGPHRGFSNRPIWSIVVGLSIIILVGLSALRLRSPWTGWPSSELPPFPKAHIVTDELLKGRELYVKYGCNSCHAIAGKGPDVGPDLTEFQGSLTREHIKNFILSPPENVAMPSYRGRMTDGELKYVTDFVFVMQTQPKSNGQ